MSQASKHWWMQTCHVYSNPNSWWFEHTFTNTKSSYLNKYSPPRISEHYQMYSSPTSLRILCKVIFYFKVLMKWGLIENQSHSLQTLSCISFMALSQPPKFQPLSDHQSPLFSFYAQDQLLPRFLQSHAGLLLQVLEWALYYLERAKLLNQGSPVIVWLKKIHIVS